jgi:hypothetical protein
MFQGGFAMPSHKGQLPALLPALLGAVACVAFARLGFLAPFFLIPLGVLGHRFAARMLWTSAAMAAALNILVSSIAARAAGNVSVQAVLADGFYFSVLIVGFSWILSPPSTAASFLPSFFRIRASYRIILASLGASLALWPMVAVAQGDATFLSYLRLQAEAITTLYAEASGPDVVQKSIMEQYITPDLIIQTMGFLALRGAAAASHAVFLYLSFRFSQGVSRSPIRRISSFVVFRTESYTIWVFSLSLLCVLLGTVLKVQALEIGAWNILVLCSFLYLAQGFGILTFFLARPGFPLFFRFLIQALLILAVFSPGINAVAAGGFILLGIAENWLPLRAAVSNAPTSTPRS